MSSAANCAAAIALALIAGAIALEFASAPPEVSRWGVRRELWPKIYNARALIMLELALAFYAGRWS